MWKFFSCCRGIKPRTTSFSHQCSNHWATTTNDFQDINLLPLYCWVVLLVVVSYSTDNQLCAVRTPIVTIKPFQSTNYGFSRHREGVLMAHNWWFVEYETAGSGTTQQYKGNMWESWKSWVVVAQWSTGG